MMKRIVILLAVFILVCAPVFAQAAPPLDPAAEEEPDFTTLMNDFLSDDGVMTYDLTEFQGELGPEQQAVIEATLIEQGYDEETIAATKEILNDINAGTVTTLQELRDDGSLDPIEDAVIRAVAKQAVDSFDPETKETISKGLQTVDTLFNLLGGFGQATANTAVASSLFGYQGYKIFALSFGLLGTVATDIDKVDSVLKIVNSGKDELDLLDDLEALGISAGVALQGFSFNVGVNMSWLVDGLYVGAVMGQSSTSVTSTKIVEELMFVPVVNMKNSGSNAAFTMKLSTGIFGIRGYYQLIKPFKVPVLFRWNGLNVGTGFIYTGNAINANMDLLPLLDVELPDQTLDVKFKIDSKAYTIPLEISTGVQLLSSLTVSAGAGLDVQFGSSTIGFDLKSSEADSISSKIVNALLDELFKIENMNFPYNSTSKPAVLNPRVGLGVGLGVGPISFDVAATMFLQTGLSVGANIVLRF